MKKRRSRKNDSDSVTLFPFLAVLICTMGSLIVLLVVLVQQARLHAQDEASDEIEKETQRVAELKEAKQMQDIRVEVLTPRRDEMLQELDGKRLQLGHLEDHIARLESRWEQLLEQTKKLRSMSKQDDSDRALAEEQLALIQEQIDSHRQSIDELEAKLAKRQPSYAIVPYHGGNGTKRRPIFLECLEDKIVLRPENIELLVEDFRGPLGTGPGNPLDAALRTIHEQYTAAARGEPYPLLIVRPSGAHAYAAARQAMTTWDDEFGYELIGADKKLEFPRPDPMLASRVRDAIKRARNRQALLAAAMPSGFGGGQARYVAKRRGGLERISESPRPKRASGAPGMSTTDRGRDDSNAMLAQGDDEKPLETGGPAGTGQAPLAAISNQRGSNWGVPNANENTQGFTRPVRVACLANQLMILPPKGQVFPPITQQLNGPMSKDDAMNFVSKLWKHMESWGIASQGGYWIPVLSVEVQRGAEGQFKRFTQLLAGSGIQIKRKSR